MCRSTDATDVLFETWVIFQESSQVQVVPESSISRKVPRHNLQSKVVLEEDSLESLKQGLLVTPAERPEVLNVPRNQSVHTDVQPRLHRRLFERGGRPQTIRAYVIAVKVVTPTALSETTAFTVIRFLYIYSESQFNERINKKAR